MAFSTGGGIGRGVTLRGRRSASIGTLSEMNVVPLVDVVLVLLIIFMVTAHVMESGLDIEVPQVKEVKDTVEDLPIVQISKSGKIFLNEKGANINELGTLIAGMKKQSAYVEADRRASVEQFVQVIYALGQAHIKVQVVAKEMELQKP